MSSHSAIIREAGRTTIATALGVSLHTVNSWVLRDSIPVQHWPAFDEKGWARSADLLAYAAANPRAKKVA